MGNYSRKEILQLVEEEDVEFIRLQFTDMFGVIKNIAVTSRELPRVLDNRCRSTSWVHSDYPDIVFADLGLDPVLPDQTDTVLDVILTDE